MLESTMHQASLFTFGGKPILAIDLTNDNNFNFQYITADPQENNRIILLQQQSDPLSTTLSIDELFSDTTFEKLVQNAKTTILTQISEEFRKIFNQGITDLKSQLLDIVAKLEDLQSSTLEFHTCLLERASKTLNSALEEKLTNLKKSRDILLSNVKSPKEVDKNLEAYVRDLWLIKQFDFKDQIQAFTLNSRIPLSEMKEKVNELRSYFERFQNKLRQQIKLEPEFCDIVKTCTPDIITIPDFIEASNTIKSVTVSPDGQYIAAGTRKGVIDVWLGYETKFWSIADAHKGLINSLSFSSDSRILASGGATSDKTICFRKIENKSLIHKIKKAHDVAIICVRFSPNDTYLGSASTDAIIKLWKLSDYTLAAVIPSAHRDTIFSMDFANQGNVMLTASADSTMKFWDLSRKKPIKALASIFRSHINSTSISPSEKLLACGQTNHSITIWFLSTQKLLRTLKMAHNDLILCVRFLTQDKFLLSNSARKDQTIKFWNVCSGELLKVIKNQIQTVWKGCLEISPQKKWAVYEDSERGVSIMKYEPEVYENEFIRNYITHIFK